MRGMLTTPNAKTNRDMGTERIIDPLGFTIDKYTLSCQVLLQDTDMENAFGDAVENARISMERKTIKRIYISAPISGCEETAEARFADAVKLAREHGFVAVNPYAENKHFSKWSDAVIAGLKLLNDCDAIMLCKGYHYSRGCRIEQQFAQGMGIEVLFEESLRQTDDVFYNKIQ